MKPGFTCLQLERLDGIARVARLKLS
jgi:hypothetical protein